MAEFILTRRAHRDMALIGQFTQNRWGPAQRNRYLDGLVEVFTALAKNPHLGRPRGTIKPGLLSYVYMRHVIYFRVADCGIEVLRILHQRMDAAEQL